MRWLAILAGIALHGAMVPAAIAQQVVDEATARARVPHDDAMKQAAAGGRAMYLYDHAAWHATVRFVEDWNGRPPAWLRRYFVEPGEGDQLTTVIFGDEGGK